MNDVPLQQLLQSEESFQVFATTEQSQVASMTLKPGDDSGDYGNEHPTCDQIMVVLEGVAEATVGTEVVTVERGGTLLIKAGEDHQIRNKGSEVLRTINVYAPPAYREDGKPL